MSLVRRIVRKSSFKLFRLMDGIGLHVLPKHYYTPIADYTWLESNKAVWARRTDLSQLEWDVDAQLEWLRRICIPYYPEVAGLKTYREATAFGYGPGYGPIESQVLHCFLRCHKPRRLVEVGSGVSTVCSLKAMELNALEGNGHDFTITCIEPYPRPALQSVSRIVHVRKMLQQTDPAVFDQLGLGDLLFIDSSHAVKPGSDVLTLLLEVVPRLKPGVFIHLHDVYLPYVYSPDVLEDYFGWQETALLLALLKGNSHLQVLCCLSALHYDRRQPLQELLTDYVPQQEGDPGIRLSGTQGMFPSSIWLTTT
jgi:hypothetical protein